MFLLICDKTTFLKHFDYRTKIQEARDCAQVAFIRVFLTLALSTSQLILSVVKSCGFFLFFLLCESSGSLLLSGFSLSLQFHS